MSELFLKNEKVLTLKDVEGVPKEIVKINAPELLPLCLKKECTTELFFGWLSKRNIPEKREGLQEAIDEFGRSWLETKNYFSLSDQYWLKKRDETWKRGNFFTNWYSTDIGEIMFTPWAFKKKRVNGESPDATTNGLLRKRWKQNADKTSYLVKAGSLAAHQEPLSEVLVSVLTEKLGVIKSAGYELCIEGTLMCSKCENFITEDTDLVPASYFYNDEKRKPTETVYDHLISMCEKQEIPGAKEYIDWTIFIDNLTGNEDRNLSNIGFIRDINTLKFIGPAPLYDCGNAYWSTQKITDNVRSEMFKGVEDMISKKLKQKCDLSKIFADMGYETIINAYPEITDVKKKNLIEAIKKRNNRLINERSVNQFER